MVQNPEGNRSIAAMLDREDEEIAASSEATHYLVAVGRLKPWPGLARPLLTQIRRAVGRRVARAARAFRVA